MTTTCTAGADWYFAILLAYKAKGQPPSSSSLSYRSDLSSPELFFKHCIITFSPHSQFTVCFPFSSESYCYKTIYRIFLAKQVFVFLVRIYPAGLIRTNTAEPENRQQTVGELKMMHRCGSSQGNIGGPCSCGLFPSQTNPFSMFFSTPNHKPFDEANNNIYHYNSSPSSVDCTLSLGTPSTRMTENEEKRIRTDRRSGSCVSNFCWDLLHPRHGPPPQKNSRGGNNGGCGGATNGCIDPLLARRCANCDTTSTPLWRNGPRGPKSLCNACGIRFKKEERRASAAAATTASGASSGLVMGGSWLQNHSQAQKSSPYFSTAISNDYMFIEDESRGEPDNSISFLSWRLNVTDRPGLVHDFTR